MSQEQVFNFLKNKRLSGDDSFFTYAEIQDGINTDKESIRKDVIKLLLYGFLESKVKGLFNNWNRAYRIKEEYIKNG
jgi:hypothetical protein